MEYFKNSLERAQESEVFYLESLLSCGNFVVMINGVY